MNDANNLMSLAAYAKRRGVSSVAVSKAVSTGRLTESVVRDERGAPKIGDPELADREWEENTRPRVDKPLTWPATSPEALDVPDYLVSRARREAAAARREAAQAEMAEIELAERKASLVPVAEARANMIDKFTVVKTRLLGVPTRVAQRMPHVAAEAVPVIDALLREALEELAADVGDDA
jgi:hypothetical protein